MRKILTGTLGVALAVAFVGCGDRPAPTVDNAALVRATADKTTQAGSSKIALRSTTTVLGQEVTLSGRGAFDYAAKQGRLTVTVRALGNTRTIEERIVGGSLFLALPGGADTFYELKASDLVGTTLASGADPASLFGTLKAVSGPVSKVGTQDVGGVKTTHYRGNIDLTKVGGAAKELLGSSKPSLPFDAYLDDQGRMRKLVQHAEIDVQGQKVLSTTTLELFDFGTRVVVTRPPADKIKDGASFLGALQGA